MNVVYFQSVLEFSGIFVTSFRSLFRLFKSLRNRTRFNRIFQREGVTGEKKSRFENFLKLPLKWSEKGLFEEIFETIFLHVRQFHICFHCFFSGVPRIK